MKEFLKNKVQVIIMSVFAVIILTLSIVGGITISNLNNQVNDLNKQIENMNKVDEDLDSYIETIETELNTIKTNLNSTNTKIDELEVAFGTDLDEVEESILEELNIVKTSLETELEEISTLIEGLTKKDSEIESRIFSLETSVDNLNTTLEALTKQVNKNAEDIKALEEIMAGLETGIDDLEAKLEELETKLNSTNTKIEELEVAFGTNLDEAEESILEELNNVKTSLETELEEISTLIEGLTSKDSEIESRISSLETSVNNLNATLEALTIQVNKNAEDIKALEDIIAGLETRINCLEGNHIVDTSKEITYTWSEDYSKATAEGYCVHCEEELHEIVTTTYLDEVVSADFKIEGFESQSKEIILTIQLTNDELTMYLENQIESGITDISIHTPKDAPIELFDAIKEGLISAEIGTINLTISGAISIPEYAFVSNYSNKSSLNSLKSVNLVDATTIGKSAFSFCEGLEKIEAPKVQSIEACSFENCSSLTEINMTELTFASYGAFALCTSLKTISLPKLTTADGDSLFVQCESLETVYLPELIAITCRMFAYCPKLEHIYVPKVTLIEWQSFLDSKKDGSSYVLELTTSEDIIIEEFAFDGLSDGDLNPIGKYINLILNSNKINEVNGNTYKGFTFNSIEFGVDIDATNLTADELKEELLSSNLTNINIKLSANPGEEMFKAINEGLVNAEYGTINLILSRVETISNMAFYYFAQLKSIYLPNTISIGKTAFAACHYLEVVNAPNVVIVDGDAFNSNIRLNLVYLPLAESINDFAFIECKNLENIDLPSAKLLGNYAFLNCTKLTSINIPSVTNIGDEVFMRVTELREVIFGMPLTEIGIDIFGSSTDVDTTQIDLVFASGQKNFTGDNTNGWTITEDDIPTGENVSFLGYTFKSITIAE